MSEAEPSKKLSDAVAWYRGLRPAFRAGLWVLLAVEAVLIAAAERDIGRRAPDELRGSKLLWRLLATQNVIGPGAYFLLGRRAD